MPPFKENKNSNNKRNTSNENENDDDDDPVALEDEELQQHFVIGLGRQQLQQHERVHRFRHPEEDVILEADEEEEDARSAAVSQSSHSSGIWSNGNRSLHTASTTPWKSTPYPPNESSCKPLTTIPTTIHPHKAPSRRSTSVATTAQDDDETRSYTSAAYLNARLKTPPPPPLWLLPVLMFCVVAGTSLWFSGNVVLSDIAEESSVIDDDTLGFVVSAVNAGFIAGALSFAITSASDRMPPTRLFMRCCIMGAISNLWLAFVGQYSIYLILSLRFFTGFCLAGIYPVGMKVASDWYENGLGTAMGYLVGCVVMGTALPFMLDRIPFQWRGLIFFTSGLATLGGAIMGLIVPDGPYRKPATKFDPKGVIRLLTHNADYRCAVCGYLAHMWEVYVYWGFVVEVWYDYLRKHPTAPTWDENTLAFVSIGMGWLGCIFGGYASQRIGSAAVAATCLLLSGTLCLVSPLLYRLPAPMYLIVHLFWGMVVVADTPQLSTLISQAVPANKRGSALTLSTCLGYAISIVSVQIVSASNMRVQYIFLPCGPGPLLGVWQLRGLLFAFRDERCHARQEAAAETNNNNSIHGDSRQHDDDDYAQPQKHHGYHHHNHLQCQYDEQHYHQHHLQQQQQQQQEQAQHWDGYQPVAASTTSARTTQTGSSAMQINMMMSMFETPWMTHSDDNSTVMSSDCDGFENYLRGE